MSYLKKIEFSGIRCFPPESETCPPVIIDFDSPITILKGENGSGKSTIIETIKIASNPEVKTSDLKDALHKVKIWGKKHRKQ
jgi:predicted ATPase